jgi:dipeptidyl aminopeptidase/acylaminoacyl peptidase
VILVDSYAEGDHTLYRWRVGSPSRTLLYGVPLEERRDQQQVPLNGIKHLFFTPGDRGLLFITSLFVDTYGLGYLDLANPEAVKQVAIMGVQHSGMGELVRLKHLRLARYLVEYNIDGCSWLYEGIFDEVGLSMRLERVLCGQGSLANGTLEAVAYDKASDRFALSFSSATSPSQLYTIEGEQRAVMRQHTRERVLGLPEEWLSPGEDASFTSFDGLRISARLYLPSPAFGFEGPRPLVYYIHGGPQGQERPDFTWFSMPLIQFLTLNGFAVFVPNVRGSTGYGLSYTKWVDKDFGGRDRLDHVHAMTQVLPQDERLEVSRAGVVGRSYGGYMTLTLASRHPELWGAGVDMFGPYDLITFSQRIPESWKPYFELVIGHPQRDQDFLLERSPRTYMQQIGCPLLVIQGQNDPRVIERESRDVVEQLMASGKQVDYLVFEDEGHDVLKYANRIACYTAIAEFFKKHL